MKRLTLLAAFALAAAAADAGAQLVPVQDCGTAIPCSIPKGFVPADAAPWIPNARAGAGSGLFSFSAGIEESLKLSLDTRPVEESDSERAARLFVRKYPAFTLRPPPPAPTPAPPAAPPKSPSS
jgi:hypothetical protein